MEIGLKVGDIMTRNFVHVSPETDLRTCAKTLVKKRVGSLIILEDHQLKGILTEKDIVWAVVKKSKKGLREIKAKDLMKRKVITIKPSADITEAIRKFRKKKVRRLPVVENKKVIGMITQNDILKIDPGLFQLLEENIKIKEEAKKLKATESDTIGKAGICEECGNYEILFNDSGQWLCQGCNNQR